jgi:hypothetical protein
MAGWHEIVACEGSAETGQLGFQLNVGIPEAMSNEPASDRQLDAVALLYNHRLDDLTACQAHALLSTREYARLCCETIFKNYPDKVRRMLAPCLAAFVTQDDEMLRFVTIWSERNFERGTGSPRVRGTPYFNDMEQFGSYIAGCMEMNGWTLGRLKEMDFR